MSNRRRPRIDHGAWPTPGPGQAYCNQPAVALNRHEEGAVELARKASHDSLIEQLGNLQRSGIWWTHHHPGEAGRWINQMYDLASMDPSDVQIVGELRDALQDPSALLVVAWCIGEVPEGVSL